MIAKTIAEVARARRGTFRHLQYVCLSLLTSVPLALFGASPTIISISTYGELPISYTDSPSGISATIGTLDGTCTNSWDGTELPGGANSIVLTIDAPNGGFIVFRYRYRTMGHSADTFYPLLADGFEEAVHPFEDRVYFADSRRYAVFYYVSACVGVSDTGWVESAVYIPPDNEGDAWGTVEMWFTVGTFGDGTPQLLELDAVRPICDSAMESGEGVPKSPLFAVGMSSPGIPQMERQPISAAAAAACSPCPVCAFTPLPSASTDPDSIAMESGYDPWAWVGRLEPVLTWDMMCLKSRVEDAGGTFTLNASYRTSWYQSHIFEVWDKFSRLYSNPDAACAALKAESIREQSIHHVVHEAAGVRDPRHVRGAAIDVKYRASDTHITEADFVRYADECGLYRRVASDLVHFEVKP